MSTPGPRRVPAFDSAARNRIERLRIGTTIPDVWADGTDGPIQLHRWASGGFTLMFDHPSAYAHWSERDLVALARAQPRFEALACQVIGITQSDPVTECAWIEATCERYGIDVPFPILSDEDGRIATAFGMATGSPDGGSAVSTTVVVDPDLRVRAVLEHPQTIVRDPTEALRIVAALAEGAAA